MSRSPLSSHRKELQMTDLKDFTVTVTVDHLNESLALYADLNHDARICSDCILAVAVKPILGKKAWVAEYAIAKASIDCHFHEWNGDETAQRLVDLFDSMQYDKIREMLPVSVNFTR
jgi:hypothetical protein